MSWWKKLLGIEPRPAASGASGGLGTLESADVIILDSGRAVRVHPNEKLEAGLDRGARVSVESLETEGALSFARGVKRSEVAFEQRELAGLVPPRAPPPESAAVLEERKRVAEENKVKRLTAAREERQRWMAERAPVSLDVRRVALAEHLDTRSALLRSEALLAAAKPAVRGVAMAGESSEPSRSRLGGRPFLPSEVAWPEKSGKPLTFLGQWRLDQLPPDSGGLGLPSEGHLLFFYDAIEQPWGFEPTDRGSWQVVFVPPNSTATLRDFPQALPEDARFPACPLMFGSTLTLPSPFSERYPRRDDSDEATDAAWELTNALEDDEFGLPQHQVGGWPHVIQSDMERECQLASSGVRLGSPADHQATSKPGAELGVEDWALLFQIDTDEDGPGWMWGDGGMVYFWIRRADLVRRDFSKTWLVLQCT